VRPSDQESTDTVFAVHDVTLCNNDSITVPGDTIEGCRFIFQDLKATFSCCYSTQARGDDLCDPQRQDGRCRKNVRVDEREASCVIFLTDIKHSDGGRYHVIFPGKLHDNKWIQINVKDGSGLDVAGLKNDLEEETGSNKTIVSLIIFVVILVVLVLIAIVVLILYVRRLTMRLEGLETRLGSTETDEQVSNQIQQPRELREYSPNNLRPTGHNNRGFASSNSSLTTGYASSSSSLATGRM